MRTIFVLMLGMTIAALMQSCVHRGMVAVSERPPGFIAKDAGKPELGASRPIAIGNGGRQEVYVKKKNIDIQSIEGDAPGGSLWRQSNKRNDLYAVGNRGNLDELLTIEVLSDRSDKSMAGKDKAAPTKAQPAAAEGDKKQEDPAIAALLKALPDLEPGDVDAKSMLIKRFKMKVIHRYANGDLLAYLKRASDNKSEANNIEIRARIPYERFAGGTQLTTDDLTDVQWSESGVKENVERRSVSWEDEYTMRLSGFDEARSKVALDLQERQQQMAAAREQLQKSIETFGDERRTMAKEREQLLIEKKQNQAKIAELQAKVPPETATEDSADQGSDTSGSDTSSSTKGDTTNAKSNGNK